MTVIATSTQAYSNLVKREQWAEYGYCKKVVIVNQSAATLAVGSVLGSFIASPVGTAGAVVGTGNGAMGAITMTSNKDLVLGTYTLKIVKAVANAGDFVLLDPNGKVVGNGQVGTAFSQAGFAFTLADGATDFVAGDYIPIVVTGTVKYKLVEATATDGTEVARVVLVGDSTGKPLSVTVAANTDTNVLVIYRGPVGVADDALAYGASVNTADEIATAEAQLEAAGIDVLTQI
jgi:hypothetical protein